MSMSMSPAALQKPELLQFEAQDQQGPPQEEEAGQGKISTHIHAYIIHTCIHTYMHTYIHTCIHTCIYACIHASIPLFIKFRHRSPLHRIAAVWQERLSEGSKEDAADANS